MKNHTFVFTTYDNYYFVDYSNFFTPNSKKKRNEKEFEICFLNNIYWIPEVLDKG